MSSAQMRLLAGDLPRDESTRWLTAFIRETWPFATNIVQSVLLEYVQPALEAAVPAGLPVPRFTKIDMGPDAVEVTKVSVFERRYANETCVVLEADILYDGRPNIEMAVADFTFGVDAAKIQGRVEILLRPLLDRIPLIGACQVAFINRPTLDYNLTGLAAWGQQYLISGVVRSAVEDVLSSMAVLPNRVAYKVDTTTDYFRFVAHPIGILRVAALSGTGFPCTDRNILKQAIGASEEPDVYLTLRHGSSLKRTDRIDDSTNPVWKDQIFDFVLTTESRVQELRVEAYDYDLAGSDDFLGHGTVLVSDLISGGVSEIDLHDSPEDAKPKVKLTARWLSLSSGLHDLQTAIVSLRSETTRPKNCSPLLLSIEVDEAKNLPSGKRPYVCVSVGTEKFQTRAVYHIPGLFSVENPDFEESFHVSLPGNVDAGLKINYEVIDLISGAKLGNAYSSLAEAVMAGPRGKEYTFALLGSEKANASLRVRVRLEAVLDQPPLWEALSAGEGSSS